MDATQLSDRPRVMVSSVVAGFEDVRAAARRGIVAGGGEPVMVNEDFPALGTSPRNACLDAVDSSDAYLVAVGARGGFVAPSGRLVVEEEYERAVARGLPIIAFLQDDVPRDPDATRFAQRVSDYVGGQFRVTFTSAGELEGKVAAAVHDVATRFKRPRMDPAAISARLLAPERFDREVVLRTVFAPVRDEEVIDALELGRSSFQEEILEIGERKDVGLFSRWHGKQAHLEGDKLVVMQDAGDRQPYRYVRLELEPNGVVLLDSNVTGMEEGDPHGLGGAMQVVEGDVARALTEQFAFVRALYDRVDAFQRQHAVHYDSALIGVNYRMLVRERRRGPGSFPLSMRGDEPIIAHPSPRQIGRGVLAAPVSEVDRTMEMFRRRMMG